VPILLIVVFTFALWTIIALMITGFSDPGIIPRQTRADAWRQVLQSRGGTQRLEDIDQRTPLPQTITMLIDGEMATCRYCSTCHVYKPPRASHCSDCDNCCKEFDHHCPFVGNCVGERNYGAFCAFLICVVALIVSVLTSVLMVSSAVRGETTFNLIFILVICGYSLLMFFVIGGFSAFHCFLVVTGQTTKQKLKGLAGDEAKGRTISCINRPPSLIDPRRLLSSTEMGVEMSSNLNSPTDSEGDESVLESVRLVS